MRLIELTSHIVFDVEEVSVCTLHDGDEGFHRCNFLNLFLQEPEDELLTQSIVFVACCGEKSLDLTGDFLFLRQGKIHDLLNIFKVILDARNCGNLNLVAAIQLVLNHHEGVPALLQRLAVEVTRQLGKVLTIKPNRH